MEMMATLATPKVPELKAFMAPGASKSAPVPSPTMSLSGSQIAPMERLSLLSLSRAHTQPSTRVSLWEALAVSLLYGLQRMPPQAAPHTIAYEISRRPPTKRYVGMRHWDRLQRQRRTGMQRCRTADDLMHSSRLPHQSNSRRNCRNLRDRRLAMPIKMQRAGSLRVSSVEC